MPNFEDFFFFALSPTWDSKEIFHRKYYCKPRYTARKADQKYSFYRCYPWVCLGSKPQGPVSHSSR